MNAAATDAPPTVPVYLAEKMPSKPQRVAATLILWPSTVAVYWLLGATFWMWGGETGFLDDRLGRVPLDLPFALLILLGWQFVHVRSQLRLHVLLGFQKYAYWLSATVLGAALGFYQAVETVPSDAGLGGLAVFTVLVADALSILFGMAVWVRFNN